MCHLLFKLELCFNGKQELEARVKDQIKVTSVNSWAFNFWKSWTARRNQYLEMKADVNCVIGEFYTQYIGLLVIVFVIEYSDRIDRTALSAEFAVQYGCQHTAFSS